MPENPLVFFCLMSSDEPEKFNGKFPVIQIEQDRSNIGGIINKSLEHFSHKGSLFYSAKPNANLKHINLTVSAHGSPQGNLVFSNKGVHPSEIVNGLHKNFTNPPHISLDVYGCHIGTGITSKNKKNLPFAKKTPLDKNDYDEAYAQGLPNNSSTIINGGNKGTFVTFNKYLIEDLQNEISKGKDAVLTNDSTAFETFLFKIYQSPNTVKLAYKDAKGKTNFFKSSAIKPKSAKDVSSENIKKHMFAEMDRFITWSKSFATKEEQNKMLEVKAKLEARFSNKDFSAQHLQDYGNMALCLETNRGKIKYAQHYVDQGYQFIIKPSQDKKGQMVFDILTFLHNSNEGSLDSASRITKRNFVIDNIAKTNTASNNNVLLYLLKNYFNNGISKEDDKKTNEDKNLLIDKIVSSSSFDPNVFSEDIPSPLLTLIAYRTRPDLIEKFIDKGADVNAYSIDYSVRQNALEAACSIFLNEKGCSLETIELLVKSGAKIGYIKGENEKHESPIIMAIQSGNFDLLKALLENTKENLKSILNIEYKKDTNALTQAVLMDNPNPEIVDLLIQKGADVNFAANVASPLTIAVSFYKEHKSRSEADNYKKIIISLLRNGANPYTAKSGFRSPIEEAIAENDSQLLTIILDNSNQKYIEVDDLSKSLKIALLTKKLSSEIVTLLIQRGADVKKVDDLVIKFASSKDKKVKSVLDEALKKGEISQVVKDEKVPTKEPSQQPMDAKKPVTTVEEKPSIIARPEEIKQPVAASPKPTMNPKPIEKPEEIKQPGSQNIDDKKTPLLPTRNTIKPVITKEPVITKKPVIAKKPVIVETAINKEHPTVAPQSASKFVRKPVEEQIVTPDKSAIPAAIGESKKVFISIAKSDFGVKDTDRENRVKVTPDNLSFAKESGSAKILLQGDLIAPSKTNFDSKWADFGGLHIVEDAAIGKKVFNCSLQNASFRNVVLENVDFSDWSKEDFASSKIVKSTLINCLLPKGIKIVATKNNNENFRIIIDETLTEQQRFSGKDISAAQLPNNITSVRKGLNNATSLQNNTRSLQ